MVAAWKVRPGGATSAQPRAERSDTLGMRHIPKRALQGQKRFAPAKVKLCLADIYAFAPVGRTPYHSYSQGVALGYALVGPSARRSGVTPNVR